MADLHDLKILQLVGGVNDPRYMLAALCEDGTVWLLRNNGVDADPCWEETAPVIADGDRSDV